MIKVDGSAIDVEDSTIALMKERGARSYPSSKLVNGKPTQMYFPQHDKVNGGQESPDEVEEGDFLEVEIL